MVVRCIKKNGEMPIEAAVLLLIFVATMGNQFPQFVCAMVIVTARAFCAVSFTARPARKTRNWIHAAPAN